MSKVNSTLRFPYSDIMRTHKRLWHLLIRTLFIVGVMFVWNRPSEAQTPPTDWSQPTDMTEVSTATNSLFPILLCDRYQNTHLLWTDRSEGGAAIFYRHDRDGSWSAPMDVLAVSDPVLTRLSAAISSQDDTIYLLWVNDWIGGNLYYSQASLLNTGNPRDWSPPRLLASGAESGSVAADLEGNIHVVYDASDSEGYQLVVNYIRSEDGGATWSNPITAFSIVTSVPSRVLSRITADDAGRIHVGIFVRSEEYGVYSEIGYVRSLYGGRIWSDYLLIDDLGTAFQGVSTLAPYAFGENEIHLTWHDPRRMHQWSSDGGTTWSEPIEIMPLGAAFGGPNALVKDEAGTVHVVTVVKGGVYSASWNGARWSPPTQIDDRPIDPHAQFISVCQGNQLHVVYDDRNDNGNIWHASRQVDAPHIERQPLPAPASTPHPTVATTAFVSPSPQPDPTTGHRLIGTATAIDSASDSAPLAQNPTMPIMVSAVPVLTLLMVVLFKAQHR